MKCKRFWEPDMNNPDKNTITESNQACEFEREQLDKSYHEGYEQGYRDGYEAAQSDAEYASSIRTS